MDFTFKSFCELIVTLKYLNYKFVTFEEYCGRKNNDNKFVIIRHDVDKCTKNALACAKFENKEKIRASYYFRIVPQSNNPQIIKQVVSLGHEIGYHYEDVSSCHGNLEESIILFEEHLNYFRSFYPVRTICMHGAPLSNFDSRDMWKFYDYHQYNIIGEPYFDIDFNEVFYLTDTGRCWNGRKYSVRDNVTSISFNSHFTDTKDIIKALKAGTMPNKLMITIHPQRWNDNCIMWICELVLQKIKNVVKFVLIKYYGKNK